MNTSRTAVVGLVALLLGACAQTTPRPGSSDVDASTAARSEAPAINYQDYVIGSAPWFDFQRLSDWSSPDPTHVVVWTTPSRAYLLSLYGACFNLADAVTIVLNTSGMVTAGKDAVIVQGERCAIQRIDQLDGRRLRAAMNK